MNIWIEKKTHLDDSEIKEIESLRRKDRDYCEDILSSWDPKAGVHEGAPVILVKMARNTLLGETSFIIGWLYCIEDPYRVSHYLGHLDWFRSDRYWKSKNVYIIHIYACPEFRDNVDFYSMLLKEIENEKDNIWASTYDDEYTYRRILEGRNYTLFKTEDSDRRIVETWYKDNRRAAAE